MRWVKISSQNPEPIICPNCKNKINLEIKKKRFGIESDDIVSFKVRIEYVYMSKVPNFVNIYICNHCRAIIGMA